jgi:hypothetical protein
MQLDPCYIIANSRHHFDEGVLCNALELVVYSQKCKVEAITVAADEGPEPTATVPETRANPLAPGNYKKLQGREIMRTPNTGFI